MLTVINLGLDGIFMKRRFLALILVGFVLALDLGGWTQSLRAQPPLLGLSSEIQAEQAFRQGDWTSAQQKWEYALALSEKQNNLRDKGRILSKLALVYAQFGQWDLAEMTIQQSVALLQNQKDPQTLAQAYNNQGTLELMRGQSQSALTAWRQSETLYEQGKDPKGVLLSRVNQVRAYNSLGKFRFSCRVILKSLDLSASTCADLTLDDIDQQLGRIDFPLEGVNLSGWLTLGDVLRKLGRFEESLYLVQAIQPQIPADYPQGELWLSVGKTLQLQGQKEGAFEAYQRIKAEKSSIFTQIEAKLLQISLSLTSNPPKLKTTLALLPDVEQQLKQLPVSHSQIELSLTHLNQLIQLKSQNPDLLPYVSWQQLETLAQTTLQQSQQLADQRLIAYSLGILGRIDEKRQQWSSAYQLTEKALSISESLNAQEIVYIWQWQLGRILAQQQQIEAAIAAYRSAIQTHRKISGEIAANREAQFAFQEGGENLYREAVRLLLQSPKGEQPSQAHLIEARQVMESLQIVSLNNFFQDNCIQQLESIDAQLETPENSQRKFNDSTAAILYPLILTDRLGVILSIPGQPLTYYETLVPQSILEKVIARFRYTVVIRSRWDFMAPGSQLYDWLIRPSEEILEKFNIKTLVIVPDGSLRNTPLSALVSDPIKREYLIQKYRVAVTPGLQLFPSSNTSLQPLSMLLGGITVEQQDKIALPYVDIELAKIQQIAAPDSLVLKNEKLILQNLERAFRNSTFPIVHLATHGVFSSNLEKTYIVIWQNTLNISELTSLLELNRLQRNQSLELLVLSACETAAGDQRAALGLAGIAVKSGARSTLATLWSVDDQGTAEFMSHFYENLANPAEKISKAEAVQRAQMKLLNNQWYAHPYYWSPFILVGNWQ